MKQTQFAPLSVAEMSASLFAGNEGYLDDIETAKVIPFETALHAFLNANYKSTMDEINDSGNWNKELEGVFRKALDEFKATGAY
jgi:F-type H+-transporting ATPase subunit alpha